MALVLAVTTALLLVRALVAELGDLFAILVNLRTVLPKLVKDFLGLQPHLAQLQLPLVLLVLAETQQESVHGTELGAASLDLASVMPPLLFSFNFPFSESSSFFSFLSLSFSLIPLLFAQ